MTNIIFSFMMFYEYNAEDRINSVRSVAEVLTPFIFKIRIVDSIPVI